jgi:PncC family amidohydrolase
MYRKEDVERIAFRLIERKQSLAVAESVSSGHLQAAFSLADDARMFFQGGITTYNLGQKSRHLHIDPIHAGECNSVSVRVAKEMALNVTTLFSSTWGIALTGYAWPVPEFAVTQPFAFFAIASGERVVSSGRIATATKAGRASQEYFVQEVLRRFGKALSKASKA